MIAMARTDPTHSGTYLHASKSLDGPWEPVIPRGCNDSTGIWQRNDSIPFGAGIAGGYGGGPFLVDAETAAASGLQEGNVVVITTYNYQYPRGSNRSWPDAARQQFAAIGIAKTWRDPLILTDKLLYQFENQNAGIGLCDGACTSPACKCIPKNGSDGWNGWSMEGGELYFSKTAKVSIRKQIGFSLQYIWCTRTRSFYQDRLGVDTGERLPKRVFLQRWRTIFHSFRKDFTAADEIPYAIHSGGYAESHTADPLGAWTCYPPEVREIPFFAPFK